MGDFEGICQPGYMEYVICEGCGPCWVDETGKKVDADWVDVEEDK